MFKPFSIITLLVIALGVTACGQIQFPASFPQLPQFSTLSQPTAAPNNSPETPQQTAPSSVPGSGPQAGRNPGSGVQAPAALLQVFHQLGWEAGVVAKTSNDQIGVRTLKNAPDKIAIGANTIFVVPGIASATLADIHVGDRIIADTPKTQTTASLVLGIPKDYAKDDLLLGLVQSNSNGLVTMRTRAGPDTLTTNAATQVINVIRERVALASVSQLQNGSLILALGESSDDAFTAQVIFALPKDALDLGKRLGGNRKTPAQPPVPKSGK